MMPEQQIDAVIEGVLTEAAADIRSDIQSTIDTLFPPASEPETEPHLRTGNLHDSITWSVEQFGPLSVLTVVSEAPYSIFLEEGTSRMAKRPFMGPAQDRWAPIIHQRLTEAFSSSAVASAAGPVLATSAA